MSAALGLKVRTVVSLHLWGLFRTRALGVPAIDGLGPRGRGFHTSSEYIERKTLVPKAEALARYLASLIEP